MDVGALLDEIRKDEEAGQKGTLELCLRQGKRAVQVRKALGNEWRNALMDATGLKKSTWYDRLSIYVEFGPLMIADNSVDPEYASISPTALKLLLKVCKGTDDNVKHEWLSEAAALSYTDLKKKVDEICGRTACDCVRFVKKEIEVCADCGRRKPKDVEEEAARSGSEGGEDQG